MSINSKAYTSFSKFGKYILNLAEVVKETPGILSYYENGKETNIKNNLNLKSNNFKFYVGQTKKQDNDQFYSEEFYIGAIANLITLLNDNGSIDIEVGSDVNKIMNGQGNNDNNMTTEEQITFIENIIKKRFKKYKEKINIINTSTRHSVLFDTIEKQGLNGLDHNSSNLELSDDFTSLDIAKMLYSACGKNKIFFNKIKGTRPQKVKEINDEKGQYYSLIEIAFRLTDYINGIPIHGGERRQERYDAIIRDIINGKYNHIESINKINQFIEKKLNNNGKKTSFNAIHISSKKIKRELDRKESEKNFLKKASIIGLKTTLAASLLIGSTAGSVSWYKTKQEDNLDERIDLVLTDALKHKNIHTYFKAIMSNTYKTDEEKISFLKNTGNTVGRYFEGRYGEGNITKKELQLFFILEMIDLGEYPYVTDSEGVKPYIRFIDKVLKNPRSKTALLSHGYNVDNEYLRYDDQKNAFKNTYNYNEENPIELKNNCINEIGEYTDNKGITYDIGTHQCHNSSYSLLSGYKGPYTEKQYIVARNTIYDQFNIGTGKKISLDYLSSPISNVITSIIVIGNSLGDNFFEIEENIKIKLVSLINEGQFTLDEIKNWGLQEKLAFINKNFSERLKINLKEITENTIDLDKESSSNIPRDRKKIDIKLIGSYKKGGVTNNLNILEYNRKKYFFSDYSSYYHGEGFMQYGFDQGFLNDSKKFSKELLKLL